MVSNLCNITLYPTCVLAESAWPRARASISHVLEMISCLETFVSRKISRYCKGGTPLLLYEASISPYVGVLAPGMLGSTGTRCSQRGMFAYAAVLLVYIDPGFAQLLANYHRYQEVQLREGLWKFRRRSFPYNIILRTVSKHSET